MPSSEEQLRKVAELSKTLKEGERILGPTRRPDGTLRKPIRIRAGYVPREEVAVYQSRGVLWKKEMASHNGPPGYDPELDARPKTKSAKKHERKKEERIQASLEKDMKLGPCGCEHEQEGIAPTTNSKVVNNRTSSVKSLESQVKELPLTVVSTPTAPDSIEGDTALLTLLIHKRIRALKKKVRLTEEQLQKIASEQLEKMTKLESWRQELKLLEDKTNSQ